jgi:hypothetical protein
MACFRWYESNFVDLAVLANTDVSSEQLPSFPVTNAYNTKRRAKVWRSNGNYEIYSGSNTLVIREVDGVDLTATVTPGRYTRVGLMAAVKASCEAVGVNTYTVTFLSNLKFRIQSSGGFFEVRGELSTIHSILGYDAVAYIGATAYTADSISIMTDEWIQWDLGIDSDPTLFALIDARNNPLGISPNAIISLEGNHTSNWTSPVFSELVTYNDNILSVINDDGIAGEPLRYWRARIVDQNPRGFVQVGAFYLGTHYSATRGKPQFPFQVQHIDRTETLYSEGGQTFSEIKPKTERFSLDWFALTTEEKERIEQIFDVYGVGIPFFIGMDNDDVFSTAENSYLRYVKFSDEPRPSLQRPGLWRMTTTIEEQL